LICITILFTEAWHVKKNVTLFYRDVDFGIITVAPLFRVVLFRVIFHAELRDSFMF